MLRLATLSAILLLFNMAETNAAEPIVQTPLGRIKGSLMQTRLNKTIYAFRGVRYGKSTEGERRFKQAEPVDSWSDIFDATSEGPSCPMLEAPEWTSEDCLRLNVYSTKLPDSEEKVNRPVIVFFHPGGFYGFSGQSYVFGPQYYLDQDIVLVTVNYRLHTLGFISTGDARAPGNLGLKDQVEALRWIQKNIAVFGGDPNSVTITGYSAGSWSCILHMMSPMSKGLFHRVIASSGSLLMPQLTPRGQPDLILRHASFVGCPTDSLDAAIECLKKVPHQELSNALPKFSEWYHEPILVWSPVVEPDVPGVERFLTANPIDLLRTKNFQHVPVIIGMTKDELAGVTRPATEKALKGDDAIFRNTSENWETAAPIICWYERGTERSKQISRELKKLYFNDEPITAKNANKLGFIYADLVGVPVHRLTKLLAENSQAPVYSYIFNYQGRYSFHHWSDTKKPFGVMHHDDLQYLFYMSFIFPFLKESDPEIPMVEKMTAMWTNFAKTGEPIPKNNKKFEGVSWAAFTLKDKKYLDIDEKLSMKSGLPSIFADRYAVWEKLFPLPPVTFSNNN